MSSLNLVARVVVGSRGSFSLVEMFLVGISRGSNFFLVGISRGSNFFSWVFLVGRNVSRGSKCFSWVEMFLVGISRALLIFCCSRDWVGLVPAPI